MVNETPPFRVRYAETDAQAVAYYGSYFAWQEVGELLFLDRLGLDIPKLDQRGRLLTVAESYMRYRRPALYDDLLVVRTRLAETALKRFLLINEVMRVDDGEVLAEGKLADVFIDSASGKVVHTPPALLDATERYVDRIEVTDKAAAVKAGPADGVPRHTIDLTVRYAETDAQGVAYFGSFYEWFESGRNELLRDLGIPYRHLEAQGVQLPVAEAYCCYLGRLGPAEPFRVTTWVHAVGRARVTLGNRITADGGRDVAVGYTMHACTNSEGRPLGLTPELAERLAPVA